MTLKTAWRDLREGLQQGRIDSKADIARAVERKHIKKALKRSPESPVMLARVIGLKEAQQLMGRGWEIRAQEDAKGPGGGGLWTIFFMEKPNPCLDTEARRR